MSSVIFRCDSKPYLIPGASGQLEVLSSCPQTTHKTPTVAVICHPHPLYGGTMQNKVVHTLAKTFDELGIHTVRFNVRGVGNSEGESAEGVGETDDLEAVTDWI